MPLRIYLPALIFPNSGNMGMPLCLFAFGDKGLGLAVVFFAVVFFAGAFAAGADFAAFFSQPRASFSTPFSKLVSPMASVAVCVGWCTT